MRFHMMHSRIAPREEFAAAMPGEQCGRLSLQCVRVIVAAVPANPVSGVLQRRPGFLSVWGGAALSLSDTCQDPDARAQRRHMAASLLARCRLMPAKQHLSHNRANAGGPNAPMARLDASAAFRLADSLNTPHLVPHHEAPPGHATKSRHAMRKPLMMRRQACCAAPVCRRPNPARFRFFALAGRGPAGSAPFHRLMCGATDCAPAR